MAKHIFLAVRSQTFLQPTGLNQDRKEKEQPLVDLASLLVAEQVIDGVDSFSDRLDDVISKTCADVLAERLRVSYEAEHGLAPAPAVLYAKTGLTTSAVVGLVYTKHVC